MKLKPILLVVAAYVFFFVAKPAFAFDIPQFPSCLNPQGSVVASYNDGVHGIVGDPLTHTGKDSVYQVASNQVTQCFCPSQGNGTQTNFLNISTLTDIQKKSLLANGWTFIPDGSVWGLSSDPYLAQNLDFTCNSQSSDTGGSGANRSSLAGTGNIVFIYGFLMTGTVFIFFGTLLQKGKK